MEMNKMRVAMGQINSTLGDIQGNTHKIISYINEAKNRSVNVIAFPELSITGYPPNDIIFDEQFLYENKGVLQEIAEVTEGITSIVGFVDYNLKKRNPEGSPILYNAAAILGGGKVLGIQYKTLLPTYDVFDEDRYFTSADEHHVFDVSGTKIGIEICEDMWDDPYEIKVSSILIKKNAEILLNISASPFHIAKQNTKMNLIKKHAVKNNIMIFYINMVGGQDELVFDGQSLAVDKQGNPIAIGKQFEEDLIVTDIDLDYKESIEVEIPKYNREQEMFSALTMGVRDYCHKNGFSKGVIGLSGGIDSSLTAAIATEALGKNNVIGISMPSVYTSKISIRAAAKLSSNLGINHKVISISDAYATIKNTLSEEFTGLSEDVTEENIQARIRGIILMAISNKSDYLVLATGNKTEMALGYSTLYGDMVGGLCVVSDVSKSDIYKLAIYYNEKSTQNIIPTEVITRRPTAELRSGQYDPFDYNVVSPLVDEIIENRRNSDWLIKMGYKKDDIKNIIQLIKSAEYKRRQAPPGIKISRKAFGMGRKMPIVNRYQPKI